MDWLWRLRRARTSTTAEKNVAHGHHEDDDNTASGLTIRPSVIADHRCIVPGGTVHSTTTRSPGPGRRLAAVGIERREVGFAVVGQGGRDDDDVNRGSLGRGDAVGGRPERARAAARSMASPVSPTRSASRSRSPVRRDTCLRWRLPHGRPSARPAGASMSPTKARSTSISSRRRRCF